ncbi:hypothetical protein D3C73_1310560 [compost metagenome]
MKQIDAVIGGQDEIGLQAAFERLQQDVGSLRRSGARPGFADLPTNRVPGGLGHQGFSLP